MDLKAAQAAASSPSYCITPGLEFLPVDFPEFDETWAGVEGLHSLGSSESSGSGTIERDLESGSKDARFYNSAYYSRHQALENFTPSEPSLSLASEDFLLEELLGDPLSSIPLGSSSPCQDSSQICPNMLPTDDNSDEANQETKINSRPQDLEGRLRALVQQAAKKKTGHSLSGKVYSAGDNASIGQQQAGLTSLTDVNEGNALGLFGRNMVGGSVRLGDCSSMEVALPGQLERGSSRVGPISRGPVAVLQMLGGAMPVAPAEATCGLQSFQVDDQQWLRGLPEAGTGTLAQQAQCSAGGKDRNAKLPFLMGANTPNKFLTPSTGAGWNVNRYGTSSERMTGSSDVLRNVTPELVVGSNVRRGGMDPYYLLQRESTLAGPSGGRADVLSKAVPFLPRNLQLDTPRNLLHGRLIGLAEALVTSDELRVRYLQTLVQRDASPQGDSMQRVTFYFLEGLKLRSLGEGHLYTEKLPPLPLQVQETAFVNIMNRLPFLPFLVETAKELILATVAGERNVHLIDFWLGLADWEGLLTGLATRPEGPPYLRVTLVHVTHPRGLSYDPTAMGMKLTQMAERLGIPFEWHTLKTRLMDFQASMVTVLPDEAVVLNCGIVLQPLADSSVLRSNPRERMLQAFNGLNPRAVILMDITADLNSQFFLKRLKECLAFFSLSFDAVEEVYLTDAVSDCSERLLVEERVFGEELVNAIACEGLDRWWRTERHETWQGRMRRAGLTTMSVPSRVVTALQGWITGRYPQFGVEERNGAVVLKWKGAAIVWSGAFRQCF